MRIERMSHGTMALALAMALGVSACAYHGSTDATTRKQLAAAGEAQPRGPVQTASDAVINGKVKAALAADDLVKARNINVDTIRGVVQLNGTVSSAAEKAQAIALARRVEGVVEVRDNLKTAG